MMIKSILESSKTRAGDAVVNPGDDVLSQGIAKYFADKPHNFNVVDANIADCLGCGYCNIGCAYGRKLSMLDEVLPKTQQQHPDNLKIISEAQALHLKTSGQKVTEIVAGLRDGRQLVIQNPKTVIVSAGTVASSWLLMQSGIGKGELSVGHGLCFNMGSPLHAYFDQKLDSYARLQIAHYLQLPDHPGFIYETWYNPPVAQSLSMPGWLDTHFVNMHHYDHMAAVGVLVGTETNAYLKPALFLRGQPDIVYDPTPKDLDTLLDALTILGHVYFAAGAKEVYASTRTYRSYKPETAIYRSTDDLDNLRTIVKDQRDIFLGTGHPQGGNKISKNRGGAKGGVIDPDFKVYGYDNLYVCDASVHPSPTTVNPQLTVMTMAHYASSHIK
jgi:choline dehydrogenase-like flavoprotein